MKLLHSLAKQFSQPKGFVGRLVGILMNRVNQAGIDWTIELLEIGSREQVLEIGYGPGIGIQKVARIVTEGKVVGLELSETMKEQAQKLNAQSIKQGRVELLAGSAIAMPFDNHRFHKVFAVNVIYFWEDPVSTLKEIRRCMHPGGRIAIYQIAQDDLANMKFTQTGVYRTYSDDAAVDLFVRAGFVNVRSVKRIEAGRTGVCIVGEK